MTTFLGWTNRGLRLALGATFRHLSETEATNYYVALVTDAVAPTRDTNTLSQLTQIATGNGYTDGGYQLTPNSTDFPTITEDDVNDLASVEIKDVAWTASGGAIPGSGSGARYAVLTTNEVTVANRQIVCFWDLEVARSVSSGQTLTLQDLILELYSYVISA